MTATPTSRYTRFPPRPRGGEVPVEAEVETPAVDVEAAAEAVKPSSFSWIGVLFVVALLFPIQFSVGSLLLNPYRLILLVMFLPCISILLSGRAGRVTLIDWLMIFSTLWAVVALGVNHPVGLIYEAMGIHVVEFFGSYLLGRVAIRNVTDAMRVARVLFLCFLIILPLAVMESVTHRAVIMDLIPGSRGKTTLEPRYGLRRAQGGFVHPILFGAFVSSLMGMAWFTLRPKGLAFLRGAAVFVGTFVSLSTGALIAFVVQVILITYEIVMKQVKRRWLLFTLGAISGYVAIDLLSNRTPFHVLVTYASFSSGSAYNRIIIWDWGTRNVADNPIFGLGFNEWVRPRWMSGSMDNFWLVIAVRFGLPACFAFMAAGLLLIRQAGLAPIESERERRFRAGYLISLGGMIIAGGTVHYWLSIQAYFLFLLGAGVWMAEGSNLIRSSGPPPVQDDPRRRSPAAGRAPQGPGGRRGAAGPSAAGARAASGSKAQSGAARASPVRRAR